MTNILFIYNNVEPTNVITGSFFEDMAACCKMAFRRMITGKVAESDLEWADVLIAVRTQSVLEADILKMASEMGIFTIELLDDDMFSLDYYEKKRPFEARSLKFSIRNTDAFLTSSAVLAEKMCEISGDKDKRYALIDTAIDDSELHEWKDDDGGKLRIAYYASAGIAESFDEIVKPALHLLPDETARKIEFTFFTVHPDMDEFGEMIKTEYVGKLSLPEFRKKLYEDGFSAGIAPLIGNAFTSSKYINKFMEYTMAAIPGIYSDVPPYKGFIRDGKDGILADNTAESWAAAIEKILSKDLRKMMAENAGQRIRDDFSKESIINRITERIPEIVNYKSKHLKKASGIWFLRIKSFFCVVLGLIYRPFARLRYDGFKETVSWIWNQYIFRKRF